MATFVHRPFAELSLRELHDLLWLRNEVFVVGQQITAEAEVDGLDPQCVHVIGRDASGDGGDGGRIVATARIFLDKDPAKVGRVAVARDLQHSGLGTALMIYVRDVVLAGRPSSMSAQRYLEAWYTRLGWRTVGAPYVEAEIPHVWMVRDLATK